MAKQVDSPAGVSVEKVKGETTERFLFPVPVENLPTKGMFYRDDIRISIKSCTVADIRDFSLIDEEDIMSVNEKLEGIISNVSVKYGRVDGSYKDLCEADKIYLLVLIKELTFKEAENSIYLPITNRKCKCFKDENVLLTAELLATSFATPMDNEKIAALYSSEVKGFVLDLGEKLPPLVISSPSIGVYAYCRDWAMERERKGDDWDKALLSFIPFIQRDWRGFNDETITAIIGEMMQWDQATFLKVYSTIEKLGFGISESIKLKCPHCESEAEARISFRIKNLFIPESV